MEFKLVINHKGKAYSKEIKEDECNVFLNKKVGDKFSGNTFGFKNYEFQVTGGTDSDGFPMRYDLPGTSRKRLLLSKGPCIKIKRKGMRKKKTVRGNIIAEDIKQININVLKEGDKKMIELYPPKEEPKKEEAPKEEIKKEEKKVEDKPKEDKSKEDKKEEKKEEPKKEEIKTEEKKEEEPSEEGKK